jgi:methylthioribulose-1-phosphate dehydratase
MADRPFSPSAFRQAAREIAAVSERLYQHGWSPATSSNYSARLDQNHCAITVSGRDKGRLTEADVMVVDLDGAPLTDGKPSAETGLHTHLYARFPHAGAVLHTHSLAATVLTMNLPATGSEALILEDYELLKALEGFTTHESSLTIPVLPNDQDISVLAALADQALQAPGTGPAYLIRGHGLYTWASDMASCYRHIEALEFLLAAELERRKLEVRQ